MIEVNEEIYKLHYKTKRRALYLKERDLAHGVVSYSQLDTEEMNGEETIPDLVSENVEDLVCKRLMIEKLKEALTFLSESEKELIFDLFFMELPETEVAKKYGLNQSSINRRKAKIIIKLKKIMKI